MEIIVNEKNIASERLVKECIEEQLDSMGFKIMAYNLVVDKEPIRVEDLIQGFLFKKTYHRWYHKIIYKMDLEKRKKEYSKYMLLIEIPHTEKELDNIKIFIKGLEDRLEYLQDSLEIIFIRVPKFGEYSYNDLPREWY
jgi:hypothetical protein